MSVGAVSVAARKGIPLQAYETISFVRVTKATLVRPPRLAPQGLPSAARPPGSAVRSFVTGIKDMYTLLFRDAGASVAVTGTRAAAEGYDVDLAGMRYRLVPSVVVCAC